MRDTVRSVLGFVTVGLALGLGLASCKGAAPVQPAASGCTDDGDCEGGVCEGEGCGPGEGVCQPRDRMCTRDLQPYCGCDGKTFRNSGSCPGGRFAHRGECEVGGA